MNCLFCESKANIKFYRQTNNGTKKVYQCTSCNKVFTPDYFWGTKSPSELIIQAIDLFAKGYTYSEIAKKISSREKEIHRSTVMRWVKKYLS